MRKTDWSAELVENHGFMVAGFIQSQFLKRTKALYSSDEHCRHFSLTDIQTATNNDHALTIGTGSFGNTYKGSINGSNTMIAINRLDPGTGSRHQFKTQIELLSQLRHPHLVSLIGYCTNKGEMILVYDYMINGTLRDHLYETDNDPLPWKQRCWMRIGWLYKDEEISSDGAESDFGLILPAELSSSAAQNDVVSKPRWIKWA